MNSAKKETDSKELLKEKENLEFHCKSPAELLNSLRD